MAGIREFEDEETGLSLCFANLRVLNSLHKNNLSYDLNPLSQSLNF